MERKGYRFQASYLRAEDVWVWTLRTSSFSLAQVWRGGGVGWDTKTAESQVIPQLKGLWVETLRRVLAFTHCWGNGGVCQMSAPYP